MICPNCKEEMKLQIAAKINAEKCKVLTAMTSVITVQCDKCSHIFQVPVQTKSFLNIKTDN